MYYFDSVRLENPLLVLSSVAPQDPPAMKLRDHRVVWAGRDLKVLFEKLFCVSQMQFKFSLSIYHSNMKTNISSSKCLLADDKEYF